jgi:hypothetical protein
VHHRPIGRKLGAKICTVKQWQQNTDAKIAWRVLEGDDDPEPQEAEDHTIEFVGLDGYNTVDTPIYPPNFVLFASHQRERNRWLWIWIQSHLQIQDGGRNMLAQIWIHGPGQQHKCFTMPPVAREMCICSSKAEGLEGSFLGSIWDGEWGQAALALLYQ